MRRPLYFQQRMAPKQSVNELLIQENKTQVNSELHVINHSHYGVEYLNSFENKFKRKEITLMINNTRYCRFIVPVHCQLQDEKFNIKLHDVHNIGLFKNTCLNNPFFVRKFIRQRTVLVFNPDQQSMQNSRYSENIELLIHKTTPQLGTTLIADFAVLLIKEEELRSSNFEFTNNLEVFYSSIIPQNTLREKEPNIAKYDSRNIEENYTIVNPQNTYNKEFNNEVEELREEIKLLKLEKIIILERYHELFTKLIETRENRIKEMNNEEDLNGKIQRATKNAKMETYTYRKDSERNCFICKGVTSNIAEISCKCIFYCQQCLSHLKRLQKIYKPNCPICKQPFPYKKLKKLKQ